MAFDQGMQRPHGRIEFNEAAGHFQTTRRIAGIVQRFGEPKVGFRRLGFEFNGALETSDPFVMTAHEAQCPTQTGVGQPHAAVGLDATPRHLERPLKRILETGK